VDSAPVLDKAWQQVWVGLEFKSNNPEGRLFYFIAELVVDLKLEYDHATTDHCGSCTACLDACPTEAIVFRMW
jgi:epoxyqueuosine reductase